MRQAIVFALLLTFSAASFSQETSTPQLVSKPDYMHTWKVQKSAAMILGIGGTLFSIAGRIIWNHEDVSFFSGEIGIGGIFMLVGAASLLCSGILFIEAAQTKKKLMALSTSLKMEREDIVRGYTLFHASYPAISLKINFK